MKDELRIIHFNTQGFQNKLSGINNFVKVHKPDILVITEHFQKNAEDLERINGYKIVNSFCRKHNERGGVAIFAKDSISCTPRKDLDKHRKEKEFELVSVSVGEDVVVTGAYRPPSTSIPDFHVNLERFIKKINKEPHIKHVLTGDFNIDNSRPNKTRTVLSENDLTFHITKETHRKGRCIDNFITNFDTAKSRVIKSKTSNISDHHPIEIIVHKEASLIAKKPDSFMYKLFRKMFDKKTAELKTQYGKGETRLTQSELYDMFSKVFDKRIVPKDSKSKSSYDTKYKNFVKTRDTSPEQEETQSSSFLYSVFSFFKSWFAPSNPDTRNTSEIPIKRSTVSKGVVSDSKTAVATPSFFSKIVKIISYAIHVFTQKPDENVKVDKPTYRKTVRKTKDGSDSFSENNVPFVYSFVSKIFKQS